MNLLIGRRTILASTAWNLLGQGVPLLAALVAFPVLLHHVEASRFGFFLLAWSVLGYFSVLDFGIGRATTRLAALADESGLTHARSLVSSAVSFLVLVGVALAAIGLAVTWILRDGTSLTGTLATAVGGEFFWATCALAIALPMLTLTAAVRGVLEGKRLFREVALVRMLTGTLMCALPAVVSLIDTRPVVTACSLVVARAVALAAFIVLEHSQVALIQWGDRPRMSALREIAPFSFWVSISNAVGAVIVYMDRFIVSAVIGLAAVTYYATAFEVVSRLLIIPGALATTLFPLAARTTDQVVLRAGIARMYRICALLVIPIGLVAFAVAPVALSLWLGKDFADASTTSVRILLVGLVFNSLAHIPFAVLQATGRSRLPALAHSCELPVFFAVTYFATKAYGIEGAAASWAVRAGIDWAIMHLLTHQAGSGAGTLRTTS